MKENCNRLIPEIPQNINDYLATNVCNLQININRTDAINGYGSIDHVSVCIYQYYEKCIRCGYHSIWHKELWDQCKRHTYEKGYGCVFMWKTTDEISLSESFDKWLKA